MELVARTFTAVEVLVERDDLVVTRFHRLGASRFARALCRSQQRAQPFTRQPRDRCRIVVRRSAPRREHAYRIEESPYVSCGAHPLARASDACGGGTRGRRSCALDASVLPACDVRDARGVDGAVMVCHDARSDTGSR
jgi:hypothetical protein